MRFIKRITRHGEDAVIYLPRRLRLLGFGIGAYVILEAHQDGSKVTITPLKETLSEPKGARGPYSRDRRAAAAPKDKD